MLVFVTSPQRSGGTWLYNVVREIVQPDIYGFPGEGVGMDKELTKALGLAIANQSAVLKFHNPSQLAARLIHEHQAKCLTTWRDPRDCVASKMRFSGVTFENAVIGIKQNFYFQDWLKAHADLLEVDYGAVKRSCPSTVQAIATHLEIDGVDPKAIAQKFCLFNVRAMAKQIERSGGYDEQLLIHGKHVAGGFSGRWQKWPERWKAIAAQEFAPWLTDDGAFASIKG